MRIVKDLVIIGDSHFSSRQVRSRVDDYAMTCINKLDMLLKHCVKNGYKNIVSLGDFTNTPTDNLLFINRLMHKLSEFKKCGINFYGIYGNHSMPNNDLTKMDKTTEGILTLAGLFNELQYEPLISPQGYTIGLYGCHYGQVINPPTKGDRINILISHYGYMESMIKDSLTKTQCMELGYDVFANGHIHTPYPIVRESKYTVLRPGRFMRNTADLFNMSDEIYVDIVEFQGNEERPFLNFKRDILKVDKPEAVFSTQALTKSNENEKYLMSLSSRVSTLLDKMDFDNSESKSTVFTVLDSLDVDYRIKERLEAYLTRSGINR